MLLIKILHQDANASIMELLGNGIPLFYQDVDAKTAASLLEGKKLRPDGSPMQETLIGHKASDIQYGCHEFAVLLRTHSCVIEEYLENAREFYQAMKAEAIDAHESDYIRQEMRDGDFVMFCEEEHKNDFLKEAYEYADDGSSFQKKFETFREADDDLPF